MRLNMWHGNPAREALPLINMDNTDQGSGDLVIGKQLVLEQCVMRSRS